MRLEVLIPTFRREELLLRLLGSIHTARIPPGLTVQVVVIDNDNRDRTLGNLHRFAASSPLPIIVLQERRPGKSTALNTALAVSTADYVGFLDDDELVDPSWFEVAHQAILTGGWDFVGGRSLPLWPAGRPDWLPESCPAVLGIVDSGPTSQPYGPAFPGILTGGNALARLSTLRELGGFAPDLGPSCTRRLLSGEDEDLYWRLLRAGAKGLYLPDLVVRHHIHPDRLRKRYYRSWFFWNGTAKGLLARRHREPVPHLLGAPRYLYRRAVRGAIEIARSVLRGDVTRTLDHESPLWLLAGFFHGRYLHRTTASARDGRPHVLASNQTAALR